MEQAAALVALMVAMAVTPAALAVVMMAMAMVPMRLEA